MEMIMDYHIVFIVIAIIILLFIMLLLFDDNTKTKTIAGMLLAGINYVLCLVNSLSFFGIGLVGYSSTGEAVVTPYHDMYSFFAVFFMLFWFNIVLIFYCWWLLVKNPWTIGSYAE